MKRAACAARGFLPFSMLCSALVVTSSWASVESLWTYPPPEPHTDASIDASPAVADLNGDGHFEIVVVTTYGHVVALDGNGTPLWKTHVGDTLIILPTATDITGDGRPEILVGGRREKFACLDGATGHLLWEWRHSGRIEWGTTAIAAADLDGDGGNEIVTGDSNGTVVCLKGDGTEHWLYKGPHGWTLCPAIGDLDGDGKLETIVGGTQMPLVCLSHDGRELWRMDKAARGASPVLADLTDDGRLEIVTGIDASLAAVDSAGTLLWTLPMAGVLDAAISVCDADQDGTLEIYAADLAGRLVKASADGKLLWDRDVGQRVRRSPSIGDVDGDGIIDIFVAGYSNAIHVFRPDGHLKALVPLGEAANGTATLVDLEGDGRLSILCPAAYMGMKAFRWQGAPKSGAVLWPEYRMNGTRTAVYQGASQTCPVRITAVDYGAFHVGTNTFVVQIENPEQRAVAVRLSATLGNDEPSVSLLQSDDDVITHHVPYTITGRAALEVFLQCVVEADEEPHDVLARVSRREYVVPFHRELTEIARALDRLEADVASLEDSEYVRERLDAFRFRLPGCRERAATASAMSDEELAALSSGVASLWQEATALAEQVEAIRKTAEGTVPRVLVSAANPWAPFGGMAEIGEGRVRPPDVHIKAFRHEHESGAVNVFNFGRDPMVFRVEMSDLRSVADSDPATVPARSVVTMREAIETPTQQGDMSADAISLLNQGEVLIVPGWAGRQLWLEFDTAPLDAGDWTGTLRLRSLEPVPIEQTASVTISVWRTALPAEQTVALCHWGYVHRSVLKDQPDAALADQIEHGTNVFVGLFAPKAKYDEQGHLIGEIDFAEHDAYVQQHASHGIILFYNYQHALQGPGAHSEQPYRKAHAAWLRAWVERLQTLGVGYDGFALYPVDEPGLQSGLVEQFLLYARLAREADPRIQIYTDPVNRITIDELEAMAPYVDIWCPHSGSFLKRDNADKLAYIKSLGKTTWTYECSGNAKHQCPLGYYRALAWLAWHHGLTGIGFWSYCTSTDDPWFRPKNPHEYLLIYQGRGVVPSKRWKAVRDGIEDYGMLTLLREAIETARKKGHDPEAVASAEALLREGAFAVSRFCGLDEDNTLPGEGGPPRARVVADRRRHVIQSLREQMATCIEDLSRE